MDKKYEARISLKVCNKNATGNGRNKICTNCQLAATCRVSGQDDNDNNKLVSGYARALEKSSRASSNTLRARALAA